MTVKQQWLVVAGIVAALGIGLAMLTAALGDELFPVTVGSKAPEFEAYTLDDSTKKTLADYRGRVVLLNIWATWCPPCRVEMPSIQKLHEEFHDEGLSVVAVSIDNPGMGTAIRDFARDQGLTFEILHDPSGDIQRYYQTTGVPETFVIGSDGVIRRKVIAAADWHSPSNRASIASLLGVPIPSVDTAAVPGSD